MINVEFAKEFANEWIDSWNSRDLDRILSHYTEDFGFETPFAMRILPESEGVLQGKESIRAYWRKGLDSIPDLHFEQLDLLIGVHSLTIYYINHARKHRVAETFHFNSEGKVYQSYACYSS